MRAVIQRVSSASVHIDVLEHATISSGLLIFLGISSDDTDEDINLLVSKILNMRIFDDDTGKMNLSVQDCAGEMMIISQFTLHASTRKGNRPSFIEAAPLSIAEPLYHQFIEKTTQLFGNVQSGKFGAMMQISLVNDGPVTILVDTKNRQ